MAFFNRKKKSGAPASSGAKVSMRRPKESLASVIDETTTTVALNALQENKRFTYPCGTTYVAALLDTNSIGGLTPSAAKGNPDKGSIVEQLNKNSIHSFNTPQMLEDGLIGIIPDSDTLAIMYDYSLLSNPETAYTLASVWSEDGINLEIDTGNKVDFDALWQANTSSGSLKELVSDQMWQQYSGLSVDELGLSNDSSGHEEDFEADDVEFADETELDPLDELIDGDQSGESEPEFDDDVDYIDDEPDDLAPSSEMSDDVEGIVADLNAMVQTDDQDDDQAFDPEALFDDEEDCQEESPLEDDSDGFDDDQDEPNEVEIEGSYANSLTEVHEAIIRTFSNGDLDLELDDSDFEATFIKPYEPLKIGEKFGASNWLNEQIKTACAIADTELEAIHRDNQVKLRDQYLQLVNEAVKEIEGSHNVLDASNRYGEAWLNEQESYKHVEENLDELVSDREKKLKQKYEAARNKAGEEGRSEALAHYDERYGRKHAKAMESVYTDVQAELSATHEGNKLKINEVRRKEAADEFADRKAKIFELLTKDQLAQNQELETRTKSHLDKINQLIEDLRAHDIAKAQTDEEGKALSAQLDAAKAQISELEEARNRELAEKVAAVGRTQQEWREKVSALTQDYERQLSEQVAKVTSMAAENTTLNNKLETVKDDTRAMLENQMRALELDKQAASAELERLNTSTSRTTRLLIGLIIGLSLLGVMVGFIAGSVLG